MKANKISRTKQNEENKKKKGKKTSEQDP